MKYLLALIVLSTFVNVNASSLAKRCLWSGPSGQVDIAIGGYAGELNQELKKQQIVNSIISHLKEIMDLKFKLADHLENNREVYGDYVSLSERKAEILDAITHYEKQRREMINKFNHAITSINPEHRRTIIKRMLESLNTEKEREMIRIDGELKRLYGERDDVDERFMSASASWSPYKEYLSQIHTLEESLLKTLEALKQVEILAPNDFSDTGKSNTSSNIIGASQDEECAEFFEQIRKLSFNRALRPPFERL